MKRGIREHLLLTEKTQQTQNIFSIPPPTAYSSALLSCFSSDWCLITAQIHGTETLHEGRDRETQGIWLCSLDSGSPIAWNLLRNTYVFSLKHCHYSRGFLLLLKSICKLKICLHWSFPHPLLVLTVQVEVHIKAPRPREFVKVCINANFCIWGETNERWCKSWVNIPRSWSEAETSWITISIQKFLSACYECSLLKIRPCVWSSLPILLKFVHRDIFVIQTDKTDHDSKQWSV